MKFFDCDGCRLELFCPTCRDSSSNGQSWRQYQLEQDPSLGSREWVCPKHKAFYDPASQNFTGKPNFYTHDICTGGKNCTLCRETNQIGTQWREHMSRMFLGIPDSRFKCPKDKPWITHDSPEAVAAAAAFPAITRERLETRIKVEKSFDKLPSRLPENSEYRKQLLEAQKTGGCTGCKRGRLINWLTDAIMTATGADKETLTRALEDTNESPTTKETEHAG